MAVLTFLIKLVLLRVPESQAANQERRELHELIWVFLEMLMIANLPDMILMRYATIQRSWQKKKKHREKELSNVAVKNRYNPYLCLVSRWKQVHMVWTGEAVLRLRQTMLWVLGLVITMAWQFRVILPRRCIWKIPRPHGVSELDCELPTEVCSKAKNSMLALQLIKEIEVAKSLDDLITPRSITGKIPRLWRIGFDDGGSIGEVLRQATTVPKENQCRRAESSKRQSVSQSETHCSFDSRILSPHWVLWRDTRLIGIVQHQKWRTTTFRILMYVGSKHCYWQVILHRKSFVRTVRLQNTIILPSPEILRRRTKRLSQTENVCKIAHWANSKEQESQDSERNYRAWSRD